MTLIPLVPARIMEPDGYEDDYDYRQFNVYVNPWLTNLIANPSERIGTWASVAAQVLWVNHNQSEFDAWDDNLALAAQVTPAVRLYPGMRLLPSTQTTYPDYIMSQAYWSTIATQLANVAAVRLPTDPRIALDIESYGSSAFGGSDTEPTEVGLAAEGYTVDQFRAAFQPVLAAVLAMRPAPIFVLHPITGLGLTNTSQIFLALAEFLGPDMLQPVWELAQLPDGMVTFGHQLIHQRYPTTRWESLKAEIMIKQATLDREFGDPFPKHRMMCDIDIFRNMFSRFFSSGEINGLGRIRPVLFDNARNTHATTGTPVGSNDRYYYGLPIWPTFTDISTVNDVAYWWDFPHSTTDDPTSMGTGTTATCNQFRANGAGGSGTVGACSTEDYDGVKLEVPGGFTFAVFRDTTMPLVSRVWTRHYRFILRDLSATHALMGQAHVNFFGYQFYYDQPTGHVFFQVSTDTPIDTGFTPTADAAIYLSVGRNGAKAWKYKFNTDTIVDVTAVGTAGDTLAHVFGGGQNPAFAPANNQQDSMPEFVAIAQGHWDRYLTTTELTALHASARGVPVGYGG
jgi:hypothetical protein